MLRVVRRAQKVIDQSCGQAAIEYALVIAILSIGMVVVLLGFGNYLVDAARVATDELIG